MSFCFHGYHDIYCVGGWIEGYFLTLESEKSVSLCAWCIPIVAFSGHLEWCVLQHRKHKASATRYHCICPLDWWAAVDCRPGWKSVLARVASSTLCPGVFTPECVYTTVCVWNPVRFGPQASSLLYLHVSLWWPPLICAVFSQPGRTRLFPIAAGDKKMSEGVSRWPFSCKDDDMAKDGLLTR